jgi:hypothetical protein
MRLTTSNIATFRERINLSDLPKTIVDAVRITREIGVQYLWVDALCIMQDSMPDWHRQSVQMASIYSESYCNFAATHTRDANDGLFIARDSSSLRPVVTVMENVGYEVVDALFWSRRVESAPLNRRGWVFQERVLAPRTVHFGFDQLLWECHRLAACEECPEELYDASRPAQLPLKGLDRRQHRAAWTELVTAYSKCQLTFPSDKLIAIGGIAKKMFESYSSDEATSANYLAGLWRDDIVSQLMWVANTASPRPAKYLAPTWSWASLDCSIKFRPSARSITSLARVVSADVSTFDGDAFGQVTSGELHLEGFLIPVDVAHDGTLKNHPRYEYGLDVVLDITNDTSGFYFFPTIGVIEFVTPYIEPHPQHGSETETHWEGLILRAAKESGRENCFTRCGVAWNRPPSGDPGTRAQIILL